MCMDGKNKCFWLTRLHNRCGTKWELPKTAVFILMKWPKQCSLVNISVIMASHVDVDNASLVIFCCWFVCCCCLYHFHTEQTSRISLLHCQAFQEQKLGSGQCPEALSTSWHKFFHGRDIQNAFFSSKFSPTRGGEGDWNLGMVPFLFNNTSLSRVTKT